MYSGAKCSFFIKSVGFKFKSMPSVPASNRTAVHGAEPAIWYKSMVIFKTFRCRKMKSIYYDAQNGHFGARCTLTFTQKNTQEFNWRTELNHFGTNLNWYWTRGVACFSIYRMMRGTSSVLVGWVCVIVTLVWRTSWNTLSILKTKHHRRTTEKKCSVIVDKSSVPTLFAYSLDVRLGIGRCVYVCRLLPWNYRLCTAQTMLKLKIIWTHNEETQQE